MDEPNAARRAQSGSALASVGLPTHQLGVQYFDDLSSPLTHASRDCTQPVLWLAAARVLCMVPLIPAPVLMA
jgi:hypothetical protein